MKQIPKFENESQEREFWENNDTSEFIDWKKSKSVSFPNLKPSTKSISIRLPEYLLDAIKIQAHKMDIPYQSLIKIYLAEKVSGK
jgi:predicted DNA binding CopG/RHH family protein